MPAGLKEIVAWIDGYLRTDEVDDYAGALNGLQLDGPREVARIAAATDASVMTIDRAVDAGCDLLLVHHGLFWSGPVRLVGPPFERLRRAIEGGLAIYSAHLPLDVHDEIGNNVLLGRAIGLDEIERFGSAKGVDGIGVVGPLEVDRDELARRLGGATGAEPFLIPGGPERTRRVAVITGGAASMIEDARAAGADTFVTGEGAHHTYHQAMELGLNVFYAGHYATETLGVRALAERVAERFGVEQLFIDAPTGL